MEKREQLKELGNTHKCAPCCGAAPHVLVVLAVIASHVPPGLPKPSIALACF